MSKRLKENLLPEGWNIRLESCDRQATRWCVIKGPVNSNGRTSRTDVKYFHKKRSATKYMCRVLGMPHQKIKEDADYPAELVREELREDEIPF